MENSFLKIALKAEKAFCEYQKDGDAESMFKHIYNMEEAHKLINLNITNYCKDKEKAIKLRDEGNEFYKNKKLKEALEKYNKCILSAPHPKLYDDKINYDEYTPLSLGYGNRSAVLFQLKEYIICICDIDRSLNLCNSKITKFKLEARKAKCLIAVEKYREAQEILKNCNILINTLELKQEEKECYRESFYKLLQMCSQGLKESRCQNGNPKSRFEEIKCADISTSISNDDLIFAYNNPTPPSLDDEPNPTIPAFSRALSLQYSPDQGRYVVATRDIKPGEVIAVETAYASCIDQKDPNFFLSFCTFCLARCAAPLPCPECTNVVFCSEQCRFRGWDKFHMKECPVYSEIRKSEIQLIQVYRIIIGHSLGELKAFVSQIKMGEQRSPLEQILNENQICESHAYRSVYLLEGNITTINAKTLIGISIKAFIMTQLLIQSKRFFVRNTGDSYVPNEEDIIFIGSLFIRHLLGVCVNAHKIEETHLVSNEKNVSKGGIMVGTGIFIAGSQFNHSCFPTSFIFFYGNIGVCRAARFIPSGSQVTVSYRGSYYKEPDRTIRRKNLYKSYSFICNCEACVSDCKLSMSNFKIEEPILRIKSKRILRNDSDTTASLKSEADVLMERNISMTMKLTSPVFDVNNYLDLLLETIEFYDRFVVIPDPMCIHLTKMFLEIYKKHNSCYFIK